MISSQIKTFRKRMKLTQDELAERLGINRATISKYESGVIVPPIEQIRKIASFLDVSIIDILELKTKFIKQEYQELIETYESLNADGRQKVCERATELAELPKYQLNPTPEETDNKK